MSQSEKKINNREIMLNKMIKKNKIAQSLLILSSLFIFGSLVFLFGSCTLFRKDSSNEMEELTEQVLKKNTGVEIDVKPIPKGSK